MLQTLVEIVNHSQLRKWLPRAIHQFDLKGNALPHRSDAWPRQQDTNRVIGSGNNHAPQRNHAYHYQPNCLVPKSGTDRSKPR
jgi:spore germination cell wall hydrolase CwlJ-like protein